MFNNTYEDRLLLWRQFRNDLEKSSDPIQSAIDFYNQAPKEKLGVDPWDQSTWPSPWELLQENYYCDFTRVLGICYSLQLCDCFTDSNFEIIIITDSKRGYLYALQLDNYIIGWKEDTYVDINKLPKNLLPHDVYPMPKLQ
jgi:hypothetical protein